MEILHAASECEPFAQTGGLADVVGALPRALARAGHSVTVALPGYRGAFDRALDARFEGPSIEVAGPHVTYRIEPWSLVREGVRVLLLRCDELYDRKGLYGLEGRDYSDNGIRFSVFGRAVAQLALLGGRRPDVLHAHDWQAGIAVALVASTRPRPARPRTVFTIHNLAYQGVFDGSLFPWTGLPAEMFSPEGVEYYGDLGFLKAGLVTADALTTVSPTYAREIQTPEHGRGLDGVLRARSATLRGILNGIDARSWDPSRDGALPARYSKDDPSGKLECRRALERELGLDPDDAAPILGVVSRLDPQKGIDLIVDAADELIDRDGARLVVLGSGAPDLERRLVDLAQRRPRRVAVRIGFDVALARRIYAGSDLFLVPSRFEPCGLSQMYAMRYGSPPIVRRTGGLADTVDDADQSAKGTGFVFDRASAGALLEAARRAIAAFRDAKRFAAIRERAMSRDDSWDGPAREYVGLYESILFDRRAASA